jgi:hypothetical protein
MTSQPPTTEKEFQEKIWYLIRDKNEVPYSLALHGEIMKLLHQYGDECRADELTNIKEWVDVARNANDGRIFHFVSIEDLDERITELTKDKETKTGVQDGVHDA